MIFLDLLFPKYCLECKKAGRYICADCLQKVHHSLSPNSIWEYEGVIRKAIIALKYRFAADIATELAAACAAELKSRSFRTGFTLVPIPLDSKRQNWRGFNQSEIVAKLIAQKMNWQFVPNLLIRIKKTPPQVGLKRGKRRQNIKNAFGLNPKYSQQDTKNPILIFDDVATTGSTLHEAKKILKAAGSKSICTLAIAG